MFTRLPVSQTKIDFKNELPEQSPDGMNIIQYLYYYNGGGVAAGDLDNDGWTDLFFTSNLGKNQLFKNQGGWKFENISKSAGIEGKGDWKTGCSMADVNADGWLDIYVCQVGKYKKFEGRNQLFINQKNGTFKDEAAAYGLDFQGFSTQAAFFDFDLDGDLDCFLLNHSVHSPETYRPAAETRKFDPLASDRMFRNEGKIFTDITATAGLTDGKSGYGLGVTVGDLNNDGWTDLYIGNDFHENDKIYINREGKFFQDVSEKSLGHTSNFSMGCDLADINNDGWQDLISLDMKPEQEQILKASAPPDGYQIYQFKHDFGYGWQFPRNNLQLNLGGESPVESHQPPVASPFHRPKFSEIGQFAGVATTDWSWSALFADFDLDGWRDLFISNGIPHRPNDSDFNKFSSTEAAQRGATDLELLQKMPDGRAKNYVFKNAGGCRFEDFSEKWGLDAEGFSNGATLADLDNDGDLDLVTNNLNEPTGIFRNNQPSRNFVKIKFEGTGGNTFGIGAKVWLTAGGQTQFFENQVVRGFQSSVESGWLAGLGSATEAEIRIRWADGTLQKQHVRAGETVIFQQKNADPAGQSLARPVFELPNGFPKFEFQFFKDSAKTENFNLEKLLPWAQTDLPLEIFENEKWRAALPPNHDKITCLRPADFDGDGDLDLFAGARSVAGAYGISPNSYFLKNEGQGKFSVFSQIFIQNKENPRELVPNHDAPPAGTQLGMISDAVWADLNSDGKLDLAVAGEWMPLTIFWNSGAAFFKTEIPNSAGFWNCLAANDFDGDGKIDLVGGNFGLNSNLAASPAEPLGLHVRDFDSNGSFDPIFTYFRQGQNWILWDKDLIISQLPILKKEFVRYDKFAQSSFEQVFPEKMRVGAVVKKVENLSSCFFKNLGGGNFEMSLLPAEVQFSTCNALLPLEIAGKKYLLAAGNFFEISPTIGRQDVSFGVLLEFSEGRFLVRHPAVFEERLAVRGLKFLKNGESGGERILVSARKN